MLRARSTVRSLRPGRWFELSGSTPRRQAQVLARTGDQVRRRQHRDALRAIEQQARAAPGGYGARSSADRDGATSRAAAFGCINEATTTLTRAGYLTRVRLI